MSRLPQLVGAASLAAHSVAQVVEHATGSDALGWTDHQLVVTFSARVNPAASPSVRAMQESHADTPRRGLWIDTTDQTAEETVKSILEDGMRRSLY